MWLWGQGSCDPPRFGTMSWQCFSPLIFNVNDTQKKATRWQVKTAFQPLDRWGDLILTGYYLRPLFWTPLMKGREKLSFSTPEAYNYMPPSNRSDVYIYYKWTQHPVKYIQFNGRPLLFIGNSNPCYPFKKSILLWPLLGAVRESLLVTVWSQWAMWPPQKNHGRNRSSNWDAFKFSFILNWDGPPNFDDCAPFQIVIVWKSPQLFANGSVTMSHWYLYSKGWDTFSLTISLPE